MYLSFNILFSLFLQDLNYLNRDLSKVIIIDLNKDAFKFNPENGFKLKAWKGEEDDVVLGELADFLRGKQLMNLITDLCVSIGLHLFSFLVIYSWFSTVGP